MQLNSVYLYPNRIDVFTNHTTPDESTLDAWKTERYRRVYNRNLKIYRSVDNIIDIQVRNSDQKATAYTGTVLVFNLIARDGKDLVINKACADISKTQGRARVTLTRQEMLDLEPGLYQYSLVQEQRGPNGVLLQRTPLYFDSQYGAIGTIEIVGDVLSDVTDSLVVDKFAYVSPQALGETDPLFFTSSIIDAQSQLTVPKSLHTFQLYFTQYSGTVYIEGSIEEQGATPTKWVTLTPDGDTSAMIEIVEQTGPIYKNITGKYNWFRIRHLPVNNGYWATFVIRQTILGYYEVSVQVPGRNYKPNDVIVIKGHELGGEQTTNDLTITVKAVDSAGRIRQIDWTGVSYNGVKTFVIDGASTTSGALDKILYR